ncbi:MAG: phage shock protein PspC [Actinobacteria bacterium]|nr:phage shock protein PspC [Actinomycetota bacterium]
MLGGVAGGVAAYLQVDPTLTRLAFVALVLAGGAGLLAYVIAWIVIPEEPPGGATPGATAPPAEAVAEVDAAAGTPLAPLTSTPAPAAPPKTPTSAGRGARLLVGALLIAIGGILLLDWAIPDLHQFFWPAAIIVFGLGLLTYGARR